MSEGRSESRFCFFGRRRGGNLITSSFAFVMSCGASNVCCGVEILALVSSAYRSAPASTSTWLSFAQNSVTVRWVPLLVVLATLPRPVPEKWSRPARRGPLCKLVLVPLVILLSHVCSVCKLMLKDALNGAMIPSMSYRLHFGPQGWEGVARAADQSVLRSRWSHASEMRCACSVCFFVLSRLCSLRTVAVDLQYVE